jgi:hypothetical protein
MWSKTNPGPFDRYAEAEPEEPIFVLLGRDPVSTFLVSLWIGMHAVMRDNSPSAALDAVQCTLALEQWARTHGGNVNRALNACLTVLRNTQFAEFVSHGMPCIKCDDSGVWIRQGVSIHDEPCPVCSCSRTVAVAPNSVPVAGNADRRH